MRERTITLFVEDFAHQQVIGPLVLRLAAEHGAAVRLDWRSAVRGHGAVVRELGGYLRNLSHGGGPWPDLFIVATDANCEPLNDRARTIDSHARQGHAPVIVAVPDPHIERWLLLDGEAFKAALGRGCDAPDRKCDRDRYKQRLIEAVRDAGAIPILGGLEHAEDIVRRMDVERTTRADRSFKRFVEDLRATFRGWRA